MTRILVVLDPDSEKHIALDRINEIDPGADVDFHVALFIEAPSMASRAGQTLSSFGVMCQWLVELIKPLRDRGYCITTEVIGFTKLYESIIKVAEDFGADAVFKPYRQHYGLHRALIPPTDWRLIRHSRLPMLLVGHDPHVRYRPIVATLDLSRRDPAHQRLNQRVIEQASLLASVLHSEVKYLYAQVLQSVSPMAVGSPQPLMMNNPDPVTRKRYQIGTFNVEVEQVEVSAWSAAEVITDFARLIGASAIVIGTVSRSGASGFLVGNTAESVVEMSRCDVFVVNNAIGIVR
jgi:universal stress protein E